VLKLSPRQTQDIAACICGDDEGSPFAYRTAREIDAFIKFTGARSRVGSASSRFGTVIQFVESANSNATSGLSGLPLDVEQIRIGLLDRREFEDRAEHAAAVAAVERILHATPVKLVVAPDRTVSLQSARISPSQRILDEQIHTAFGETLSESKLHAARVHYSNAKRHLDSSVPDYANSCKESICSLEALVSALSGEPQLPQALRRAVAMGLITKPLDEVVLKLYAYRGNEPGVGHGRAEVPRVGRQEAELLFNLAGALGKYLREKLTVDKRT
jgi:hypothetical protein